MHTSRFVLVGYLVGWVVVGESSALILKGFWYARADSNGRPFAPELYEPPLILLAVTWIFNNLGRLLSLSGYPVRAQ